jgi:RHS repeat-associated protein
MFGQYYSIAGMMVAVNDGSAVQYLLTDHLGSTVAVTNSSGTLTSQQRYLPFGGTRAIPNSPILATDFGYTGQRLLDSGMGGIMDYKARFYSPYLNRFLQPDSIIPNPANPQSMNRFGYVLNNPIRFSDPTGHKEYDEIGGGIPCYPGELVCQLMKGDGGGPSGENSDNDLVLDEEDVIDEPSYQWDVAGDLENCDGNWICIKTIMGWYYDDLGYPLDQLAANPPFQSPLGPNDLYFLEPSILMEMQNSENTRLLQILSVDYNYPYNYEPVYLETLRIKYPELSNIVKNESNWFSEAGTATIEFIYSPDGGYSWVTQYAPGWESSLWQLTKVKYVRMVIDGE